MKILLAEKYGFCFGVRDAIELAERTARTQPASGSVYTLGPVIHNKQVVERLGEAGLRTVDSLDQTAGGTVVIRSHGVSPGVIEDATARGLNVVDATCILVKRAQNIAAQLHAEGYRVVIVGDPEHPEVRGVLGYAPDIICVNSPEDMAKLPRRGKLGIISQTTHTVEHFGQMVGLITARGYSELKVVNTICNATKERQDAVQDLCAKVDVMFVLGGYHSSNTNRLAEICRDAGVDTHHLETVKDFRPEMVAGKTAAGVTAGASTPDWIIDEFVRHLQAIG
ncbi:MAG: 4-hydroxy-3-methylbut-2-enyl diphosphate reductase [Phycisphaerae bacterium]|nr:4-hydroxy-3-methylbut-2-enyl diphosphate reductase [Phycisphaerae bacterium]